MKTAISIPDEIFRRAEAAAQRMGLSRSELYARAVDAYVDQVERASLTERLDAAIDRSGPDTESVEAAVDAGRRLLDADEGDW